GTLTGVGGGTGSVFSVIPPQNASGNWIKITQRIPVRIDLSQKELNSNPLRLGLSMKALVTTKKTKGSMTPLPRNEITPRFSTTIYSNEEEGVDQVIEDILINNITDFSFDIEEYDVSLD
ncbi:MAG: hypothetical protein EBZ47_06435, partial [Chlamydiae bacterium]|nr:hypothetical protein [Chlamydiota bacterium]